MTNLFGARAKTAVSARLHRASDAVSHLSKNVITGVRMIWSLGLWICGCCGSGGLGGVNCPVFVHVVEDFAVPAEHLPEHAAVEEKSARHLVNPLHHGLLRRAQLGDYPLNGSTGPHR